jgi:hypothetical protein
MQMMDNMSTKSFSSQVITKAHYSSHHLLIYMSRCTVWSLGSHEYTEWDPDTVTRSATSGRQSLAHKRLTQNNYRSSSYCSSCHCHLFVSSFSRSSLCPTHSCPMLVRLRVKPRRQTTAKQEHNSSKAASPHEAYSITRNLAA